MPVVHAWQVRAEQVEQKLRTVQGNLEARVHELVQQSDTLSASYAEAAAEASSLEEEKYRLGEDIEVLEEELEDANASTKRYYEVRQHCRLPGLYPRVKHTPPPPPCPPRR